MTFIKTLLIPLAACVALLISQSEFWRVDEHWGSATYEVFFPPPIGFSARDSVSDGCARLLCSLVMPHGDDDADDD